MKKKALFIVFSFLLIILIMFTLNIWFYPILPEKIIEESFHSSGARIVSSEVYLTGKIEKSSFHTVDKLRRLVTDISGGLGAENDENSYSIVENDNMTGVEMSCAVNNYRNVFINAVNGVDSYITVSIVDTSENPGLADIGKSAADILASNGIKPDVNACITGNFQGRLGEKELEEVFDKIFKEAGAHKVEGMEENSLISISAYSPAIEESVNVNGKKINLNLAVRYNSYEDKTYIWLATPVIVTEY